MHVTWCSSLLSPPLFKGGIVIASARLSVRSFVRPSVCMFCSILLNHWTKSNQVWCAKFSYEWVVRQHSFGAVPLGPRGGFKGQLIFEKSISKIFILNFMFVLKNKRMRFSLCRLCRTPGVGLGVAWGQFFSQTWSCGISNWKGVMSRLGYKLNFHRMVKLVIARYSQ